MSQRNPMNDRYTTDDRKGQTRKSAAAAKPKSKAAASVHVQSTVKTKQQKKAAQKAAQKTDRSKQAQVDRKYYNPPTAEYKKLRRLWWILLVGAIAMTAFSWLARTWFPTVEMVSFIGLGLAYVLIIAALYIDFSKIRKVRRAYQEEMESKKTKETRAMEKQAKAAAAAAKAKEAEQPAVEEPKKKGLFGSGFRLTKSEADREAKKAAKEAAAVPVKGAETPEEGNSIIEDINKRNAAKEQQDTSK